MATMKYKPTSWTTRDSRRAAVIDLEKMLSELCDDSRVAVLLPHSLGRDSEPWMIGKFTGPPATA
eukprot:171389-Pleurochrysis_carterae.AAC.1